MKFLSRKTNIGLLLLGGVLAWTQALATCPVAISCQRDAVFRSIRDHFNDATDDLQITETVSLENVVAQPSALKAQHNECLVSLCEQTCGNTTQDFFTTNDSCKNRKNSLQLLFENKIDEAAELNITRRSVSPVADFSHQSLDRFKLLVLVPQEELLLLFQRIKLWGFAKQLMK